ncbi:MAG: hypothetical protein K2H18_07110 [Muribaculaceae bacterium]|nr:hypothetical protein [Muribaculaceae bacterium]
MKPVFYPSRSIVSILIALLPLMWLTSCNNEDDVIIWDMYPVNVMIHIQDADGNNLLSPNFNGNILGKKIVAIYQGKEYELEWDNNNKTRYYAPSFTGLTLKQGYSETEEGYEPDPNKQYLNFGEFDGAENQNITLLLRIEDVSENWDISVRHNIKWKGNTPKVTNTATLNGEKVSYDNITIII